MASRSHEDLAYHTSVLGLDAGATMASIDAVVDNSAHLFQDLQNETSLQRKNKIHKAYQFLLRHHGAYHLRATPRSDARDGSVTTEVSATDSTITSITDGIIRFPAHDDSRGTHAPPTSSTSVRPADSGSTSAVSHQQTDDTHGNAQLTAHDNSPRSSSTPPSSEPIRSEYPKYIHYNPFEVTYTKPQQTQSWLRKPVSPNARLKTKPRGQRRRASVKSTY